MDNAAMRTLLLSIIIKVAMNVRIEENAFGNRNPQRDRITSVSPTIRPLLPQDYVPDRSVTAGKQGSHTFGYVCQLLSYFQ